MNKSNIEAVFFSNCFWGHFEGQHTIKGQCVLRPYGLPGLPIINVENTCASGSTALYMAFLALKAGEFDVALCLGVEKIAHSDKALSLASYTAGFDTANLEDTFHLYDELSKLYGAIRLMRRQRRRRGGAQLLGRLPFRHDADSEPARLRRGRDPESPGRAEPRRGARLFLDHLDLRPPRRFATFATEIPAERRWMK